MGTTTIKTVFQFRRATAEEWTRVNPTLRLGEPGYDITNKLFKIGDGVSSWNDLAYQSGEGTVGDITWDKIIDAPTKLSQFENDIEIPDATYIDEKLADKADLNHTHDDKYQPIGNYLVDSDIPDWAKQPDKPSYSYDEITGAPPEVDLSAYATIEYVDNAVASSGGSITVDEELDINSTNPVQNKAITSALTNARLDMAYSISTLKLKDLIDNVSIIEGKIYITFGGDDIEVNGSSGESITITKLAIYRGVNSNTVEYISKLQDVDLSLYATTTYVDTAIAEAQLGLDPGDEFILNGGGA